MKKHPHLTMLDSFSCGELDEQLSIVISAHISGCRKCSDYIDKRESQLAESYFDSNNDSLSKMKQPDLNHIQEAILNTTLAVSKSPDLDDNSSADLTFKNNKVFLPRPLAHLTQFMKPWKNVNKNISYSKIEVNGSGNLYFVYFGPGAKIPEHTHDGSEYAFVVSGSFSDQEAEYISGDFTYFDHNDSHHPYTEDPDGCMLLVKLDGPFVFKEGLARLLNPLRNLIFKKF